MAFRTVTGDWRWPQRPRPGGGGFTLVELLVVLAILATLLTLAVPRYFAKIELSKETVLRQNLGALRTAVDQFYADTGKYPETLDDLVKKRYLRSVPVDPITDSPSTWQVQAPPADSGLTGVYDVRSGAEGKASDGTQYGDW